MKEEVYIRALERERKSRKEAEKILEERALQLFAVNEQLNVLLKEKAKILNQTEENYRNIFNAAFDAIMVLAEDGKIMNYNRKFLEIMEADSMDINTIYIQNIIHPDDLARSAKYFEKLKTDGHYSNYRGRIISARGNIIHVEINSNATYENGVMTGSIDVVRDVTDRNRIEKLLYDFSERFQTIFDNSTLGVVINNNDGVYVDVNNRLFEIFDYPTKEAFLQKTPYEHVYRHDLPSIKEQLYDLITNKLHNVSFETRVLTQNKQLKWVKVTSSIIEHSPNGSKQFISLIEDINDQKIAQEILARNEEKWRHVVENMELGIIELNEKGTITKLNNQASKIIGYVDSEIKGENIDCLIHDEYSRDLFYENWRLRKRLNHTAYEIKINKKNGKSGWILISGIPLRDNSNNFTGVLKIIMDITSRKKVLENLEIAKKMAEDSSKAKENFLANMSHEIRTPMNAIMGMAGLLKEAQNEMEKSKYIEAIENSSKNLLVIINDVLDISKIQANKLSLDKIPFKLSKVLHDLKELLVYKAEEKGILLNLEINKAIPDDLIGDPVRLNQILTNLISNAIKFTDDGHVKCKVELIKETIDRVHLEISVSDTGIGISEEMQDNIFESFIQEDQTTSRKYGGTGLGLTITKRLVELHHGEIKVHSIKGKGTTFTFDISYKKDDNPQETKKDIEFNAEFNLDKTKGLKVLLVEDHKINQLLAETILAKWKIHVTTADNGEIAIEKLKKESYDLVLMDVQMPVMDGLEATKHIRTILKNNIPIIALTANAIKGDNVKCIQAGMNSYVSKPINPSILFNKIIELIYTDLS